MNFLATLVVMATVSQSIAQEPAAPKKIEPVSYAKAYKQANETGRPLLVLVTAKWCGPCQQLKREILPQLLEDGSLASLHFAMVDVDQERVTAQQLVRGGNIPQFVLFEQVDGKWNRKSLVGYNHLARVSDFVNPAITRVAEKIEAGEIVAQAKR